MKRFQNYIKDVIIELKKVTWPTWDELKGATWAVIIFSIICSLYVFCVDYVLMEVIKRVADLFGT
ncbi:MAG: preprotein translocase subunit SecE [Fibrobacteria bacterium]|nr:preprotein translocase subunit SecE [Fibrobacteria bacterium]